MESKKRLSDIELSLKDEVIILAGLYELSIRAKESNCIRANWGKQPYPLNVQYIIRLQERIEKELNGKE